MSRRYCGKCGQLLWEPCLACGENNPVNERFCGKCGTDIHADLQAAQQEIAEAIATADGQAVKGRFLDAVATLEGLFIADHSQLQESAAQIGLRVESFPQKRKEAIERSKHVVGKARQLLQDHRCQQAHEQLTAVPKAFRNHEISDLLEEVETRIHESEHLRRRVKESLQQRDYENALPQMKRLAELNPNDQQIQGLLAQLQQRQDQQHRQRTAQLIKIAKAALAECDYGKAAAALKKLPEFGNSEVDMAKMAQAIKERVWLAEQLRTEPFVSPTLLVIADRLLKLQPHDNRHAEVHKQLNARWLKAIREKDLTPIPWAKPSETSLLELPVAPLSLPKELLASPKTVRSSAQAMVVAFGLALQGLGRAAISLDLAPKEKTSWLNRLALRGKKQVAQRAWGIDIGAKNLKAIQLVTNDQFQRVRVSQSLVLPLRLQEKEAEVDAATLAEAVNRLTKQCSLDGEVVVLNMPGTQTLHRFFDIPAAKPEIFFEAVEYEMRARIPLAPDQMLFDYHWSEVPAAEADGPPQRRVMLVAANREQVEERFEAFKDKGASRVLVQGDCVALCNAVEHVRPTEAAGGAIGIVEIGAETSNLVVLSGSTSWCRGLFHGTHAFDEAVSTAMDKSTLDAELLRRKPEKLTAMHELDELLKPEFASFAEELDRTLSRFQNTTGQSVSRLYLCGAGSEQFGLLRYLQSGN